MRQRVRTISLVCGLVGVGAGACGGGAEQVDPVGSAGVDPGEAGGAGTGGAGGSAGPPSPVDEASILTWNLENFPLTPQTLARVEGVLEELAPDVVAVQEIGDPAAFGDLVAALEGYHGILNNDPGAFQQLGILYRKDRVVLDQVATIFPDDWYAFPRPPLSAHVMIQGATTIDFYMVVLHLKAQIDEESEDRRRAACQALDTWIGNQAEATGEQDIVLLGDMNDKLTDPPADNVFSVFLDKPEAVTFLTLPAARSGEYTYIPFEGMIDHVLVTADMLDEVGTGETEVLHLDETMQDYWQLSDHRPVRTWLRWSK